MKQNLRSLDVTQKLSAEPLPQVGPLDQAGYVGNHKALVVVQLNHSQIGLEGGEGIISDLWTGRRNSRNQCGFPNVRKTNQSHVCKQFQFEPEMTLLPGETILETTRSAIR